MNLRPMDVGEILDRTVKMLTERFKTYFSISALGALPLIAMAVLVVMAAVFAGPIPAFIIGFICFIPYLVVTMATTGAIIKTAEDHLMGRDSNIKDALRYGLKRSWPMFAGGLAMGLAMIVGTLFLIIPGVLIYVWFVFYPQTIIIEDKGIFSSLSRSKAIVKGSWWRTFGVLLLISILTGIISQIIQLPISYGLPLLIDDETLLTFVSLAFSLPLTLIITPLTLIASTLLYFDLRIREENLDLKVMVDNLSGQDYQQGC